MIEKFDSSPDFIANVIVFANGKEDALSILDAAGSESLLKGKYNISTFTSNINSVSFLDGEFDGLDNIREKMDARKGRPDKKWSGKEKAEFYRILKLADSVEYTSEYYYNGCMKKRNARLVELADCCFCYWDGRQRSGTGQTVRMARRKKSFFIRNEAKMN